MSSYLSQPFQKSQFVSGIPLDLIMQVGAIKQARQNKAIADTQAGLDRLSQYQIDNVEDRKVIGERMNSLVNTVNQYSGKELTDGQTQNELSNHINGFYNDPDIYGRIATNTQAVAARKNMDEIIKKDPKAFGTSNVWKFNKAYSDWANGAGGTPFKETYTPFGDPEGKANKIKEEILKHPDIRREIIYKTDPNTGKPLLDQFGNKIPRGEREMKEVSAQKITTALMGQLDEAAKQQLMIDYEYKMANTTADDARKELKEDIDGIDLTLSGVSSDSPLHGSLVTAKEQLKLKLEELNKTNDPSVYYTKNKYLKDFVGSHAVNAYKEMGKLEDDFEYTEDIKFKHAMDLERYKADQDIRKYEAGVGTGKGGTRKGVLTRADGTPLIANPLKDDLFNVWKNGKGAISDGERMQALFTNAGKWDAELGQFVVSMDSQEAFIDIKPMLSKLGIDVDVNKARGVEKMQSAYDKFLRTPEGQIQTVTFGEPGAFEGSMGRRLPKDRMPTKVTKAKTYEDFLKTDAGKKVAQEIKADTGLDITNPQDLANTKKWIDSDEARVVSENMGTLLRDRRIRGKVALSPADGDNALVGSNGQLHVRNLMRGTKSEFAQVFGENKWYRADGAMGSGVDLLINKEILVPTLNKTKDGDVIYQLGLTTKVNKDLATANMDYLNTKGDKFFPEDMPIYDQDFRVFNDKMKALNNVERDPVKLAKTASDNIYKILDEYKSAPEKKKAVTDLITYYQGVATEGADKDSYVEALEQLNKLSRVSKDELDKILAGNKKYTPEAATSLLSESRYAPDFAQNNLERIKRGITGPEGSSENSYGLVNKDGAYGKYQFRKSTLGDIYKKQYAGFYDDFNSFFKDFMAKPQLQENIMDKWILERAQKVGNNPYRIALAHFLGDGGVEKLMSGGTPWTSNPTADQGVANTSPLTYLERFADRFQ